MLAYINRFFLNRYSSFITLLLLTTLTYTHPLLTQEENKPLFIVLSPPKCGTFLIGKAIEMITKKPACYILTSLYDNENTNQTIKQAQEHGSFVIAHHYQQIVIDHLIEQGYKAVFTLRDPRDQLISSLNWVREGQWPWLKVNQLTDYNAQLEELITGELFGQRCYEMFMKRQIKTIEKIEKSLVYIAKFENLVGPNGGGQFDLQISELMNLAHFLGYKISSAEAKEIAENLFSGTLTFRKGQIGQWEDQFSGLHRIFYKLLYGKLLINLGYEKDYDW